MDKPELLIEDDDEFTFSNEEMYLVLKALDVYAHAMLLSNSTSEFIEVQKLAQYILKKMPRSGLNS